MLKKKSFVVVLAAIIIAALSSCTTKKEVSGDKWLMQQEECVLGLQAFAENMDEVYSLYISGSISPDDFYNELSVLNAQLSVLKADYANRKAESPISPGNNSYEAQRGIQGIEGIQNTFQSILNESLDSSGAPLSPEPISYIYLAYRQQINSYLSDYITAYQIISDRMEVTN